MNTKKRTKQDPIDSFIFHVQNSLCLCRKIMQKLENHYDINPESLNWGHVGSAEHASKLLKDVCEFMDIKTDVD